MRKIIIIIFILLNSVYSQIGYVEVNHPIYNFLERMQSLHNIENYNSFEIPKTRKDIVKFINEVLINKKKLSFIDKKTLADFLVEFEFDLLHKTQSYYSLFEDTTETELFNQKEKFLYFYTDSSKFNAFVKFVGTGESIYLVDKYSSDNKSSSLFTFGAEITGTISNNFGFYAKATNGLQFGDKELASFKNNLKYNYKYNSDHDSTQYFDETSGYLSAEFDFIRFKIGRDRVNIGYGFSKSIMDNYAPPMDYLSMQINYSIISFSFLHGKLFGDASIVPNVISGGQKKINDKYIAYHRLGLNFSKHLQFGVGESIIYANRNIDFSYLNPFNFYKSAEHANQDRDNSMLFFDFRNNSLSGLMLYGTFVIDDIDFSKLGTQWYGNKFLYDFGFKYELFPNIFPLTIGIQYLRINPYVYAHRFTDNNYTSMNYGIGSNIQPNSESYIFDIRYKPHYRIEIELSYQFVKHGANKIDNNGNVLINYGGDILVGHRIGDSNNVSFLNGVQETSNHFVFKAKYEPIKNYLFTFITDYLKTDKDNLVISNQIISNLIFSIRI
ncbi:MAG: hypothetical protein KKF62_08305 [Bacteroidetes bacterium]|nr:hypothetical protein [Bacteroidota bacterium]MBU1113654.1 hypothetical protein [Bacteroidota bacterium]MBU1796770.1 hypothetical protein [Bacteroidota bacterium]